MGSGRVNARCRPADTRPMKLVLGIAALLVALGAGIVVAERWETEDSRLLAHLRGSVRTPDLRGAEPATEADAPNLPHDESDDEPGDESGEFEIISGGETTEIQDTPAGFVAEPIPMVRYFDGSGSIRMVEGMHNVPPRYRHSARAVKPVASINRVAIPAPSRQAFQDWQPEPNPNRIVLYSSAGCSACGRARRHLDRLGVRYQLVDIHTDTGARDQVRRVLGRVVVPLLKVGGTYVSGYLPREYDRLVRAG